MPAAVHYDQYVLVFFFYCFEIIHKRNLLSTPECGLQGTVARSTRLVAMLVTATITPCNPVISRI